MANQSLLHNWPRKLLNSTTWWKIMPLRRSMSFNSRSPLLIPIESPYTTSY